MFGIGGWELLMIAVVALIVLGPKGLPAAARAIGRAVSELRRATSNLRQSIELDPQLKDIPQALDELNRPLLSSSPYPRKRMPKDGPPPGLKEPPVAKAPPSAVVPPGVPEPRGAADLPIADEPPGGGDPPLAEDRPPLEKVGSPTSNPTNRPRREPTTERTTTKPVRTQRSEEPPQHVDEPDGRDG